MGFDIHELDALEGDLWDEKVERAFERYRETLLKLFSRSPEGQAFLEAFPDGGFWPDVFLDYGFSYLGVTPPRMTVADVEELLLELFPRKVVPDSSGDFSSEAISGLVAFWEFLKREYKLPAADRILKRLQGMKGEFKKAMSDVSRFGIGKSIFTAGQEAGFDMTDEKQFKEFITLYNLLQSGRTRDTLKVSRGKPRKKRRKATKAKKKRRRK